MVNEIWRDIKGYEGLYQISNFGNVKSLNYRRTGEEKILKIYKTCVGYLFIELWKNEKRKQYYVHRLVAEHFIENSQNKPEIDHINTDKTDNRVENLRWATHKENINNALTIDKKSKNNYFKNIFGIEHPLSKPIIQFSKDGEFIRKWDSAMDVQRALGIYQCSIGRCCNGKRKTAGGYIWRYYYKGIWLKNHIPMKDKMVS